MLKQVPRITVIQLLLKKDEICEPPGNLGRTQKMDERCALITYVNKLTIAMSNEQLAIAMSS